MKKKIDIKDVKHVRYHDFLSDELVERIKRLYPNANEVMPMSLNKWIDGFCYDMHPEKEVEIWEAMIERYQGECKTTGAKSKEEKKEIWVKILLESGAGEIRIVKSEPFA